MASGKKPKGSSSSQKASNKKGGLSWTTLVFISAVIAVISYLTYTEFFSNRPLRRLLPRITGLGVDNAADGSPPSTPTVCSHYFVVSTGWYFGTVLVEKIDGFHSVAAAESRRDLLDPLPWSTLFPLLVQKIDAFRECRIVAGPGLGIRREHALVKMGVLFLLPQFCSCDATKPQAQSIYPFDEDCSSRYEWLDHQSLISLLARLFPSLYRENGDHIALTHISVCAQGILDHLSSE
ncbi:hypothetical protein Y032_0635g924 [Ancylostoma ceylanicum]|uniref:Uncharacterized protein n=1 Tax=Ancylostoma ceylanicum TaxID=53326 RepID=A0A016WJZ4_9BILA|nr:hypothetical protein Y032_0635g924 [Ancylostoma ceylanicum]